MLAPAIPDNETARLSKLRGYKILDTLPEESFDRVTRLVADLLDVPIALVSLIDSDRQWFKSRVGLDATETSREISFCGHAILDTDVFVVEDAALDGRFADNPLVTAGPSIRFYAGAPLRTPDGQNIGTLCAIDSKPRKLSERERRMMNDFAHVVVSELELRTAIMDSMSIAAQEANERALQNDFISDVTHELRTPLTSIHGALRLIEEGAFGQIDTPLKNALDIASRNSVTLLGLINDLLDFQKLGAGKMEFNFKPVNSGQLLRVVCEDMTGFAARRNVTIEVSVENDTVFLADNLRIAQVLTNILSNAVKFSPKGGHVTAKSSCTKDRAHFTITDRGPGIPKDFQDKVFEKFTRAKVQATGPGTGLGLAISKIITDAHRGTIGFETSAAGTTFRLDLPLRQSLT